MSKFTEVVKEDTPRLIIMFRMDEVSGETFGWKLVYPNSIPVTHMIGGIIKAQAKLILQSYPIYDCDEVLFVIAWNVQNRDFDYFLNQSIPVTPLLGILDLIKSTIEAGVVSSRTASKSMILGPDGIPFRGGG